MNGKETWTRRHITSSFVTESLSKGSLWRVICHKGVTVRQKFDPYSRFVALLTHGTVVEVVKRRENRLKICKPFDGWVVLQMLDEQHKRLEHLSQANEPPEKLRRLKSMPEVISPPNFKRTASEEGSRRNLMSESLSSLDSLEPFHSPKQMERAKSNNIHVFKSNDIEGFRRITFNSPEEDTMERLDHAPKIKFDSNTITFERAETEELDLDLAFSDLGEASNDGCSDTLSFLSSPPPTRENRSPSLWERRKKSAQLGSVPKLEFSKEPVKSFKFNKEKGLFTLLDQDVETTRQETYSIVACAYHGSNSSVYKVSDNSSCKDMALKSIDIQTPSARRMIYCEIKVLRSLQHSNIIKFYDVAFNPKTSTISILLEWMEAGCLSDVVKISGPLKPARIRKVARDILSALSYVHEKLIIHRDIKPSNVLLSQDAAKLADFGIAKDTTEKDVFDSQEIGTLNYMAPERLNAQEYSFSSDVWSFGVMIYYLAEGKTKYSCFDKLTDLIDQVCFKKDLPVLNPSLPLPLVRFVESCCKWDKEERSTCKKLLKSKFLETPKGKCVLS